MHPFSALLSAYGMGLADVRATRQQALEEPLDGDGAAAILAVGAPARRRRARPRWCGRACDPRDVDGARARARPLCRHRHGAGRAGVCSAGDRRWPRQNIAFARRHEGGFEARTVALRLHRRGQGARRRGRIGGSGRRRRDLRRAGARRRRPSPLPAPAARTRFFSGGDGTTRRSSPAISSPPVTGWPGPAIVIEPNQTIVVEDGWAPRSTAKNHLDPVDARAAAAAAARSARRPIR